MRPGAYQGEARRRPWEKGLELSVLLGLGEERRREIRQSAGVGRHSGLERSRRQLAGLREWKRALEDQVALTVVMHGDFGPHRLLVGSCYY